MAVRQRDEVAIRHRCRIERRDKARAARRRDGPGRQPGMLVGVVWRLNLEMLIQHAALVLTQRVLHRGVCLEQHVVTQAVHVNRGDDGALLGQPRLLLDDRGQRDDVVTR